VSQVQINAKIGLDSGGVLRTNCRQDPDISWSAKCATRTVEIGPARRITGHMVFLDAHTMSAVATINRLLEWGPRAT